jgi:hypothetical protein
VRMEPRAQVWRTFFDQACITTTEGFVLIRGSLLRSQDPYVGFEPSPQAFEGGGSKQKICDSQVLQPMYWL